MINIQFSIKIDKPYWLAKLFICKHEIASVEENFLSRYGAHTSYMMCLKCGRKAMEISRNCKHVEDVFGRCNYCNERISKQDCKHKEFCNEPDTDEFYCDSCGEWKETI
ncbi:MAG: hypothetical protein Q7R33_04645 [Nitrosarchaeum sp.]|nr:hypothetical protein [Nitrosarchaeum sp.]